MLVVPGYWFVAKAETRVEQRSANNELIHDPQQMRDLGNDAAGSRRIDTFDRLVEFGNSQALNDLLLLFGIADHAPVILDLDRAAVFCFCFLCHISISDCELRIADFFRSSDRRNCNLDCETDRKIRNSQSKIRNQTSSSTCFPRRRATSIGSFIRSNPLNVARITL